MLDVLQEDVFGASNEHRDGVRGIDYPIDVKPARECLPLGVLGRVDEQSEVVEQRPRRMLRAARAHNDESVAE